MATKKISELTETGSLRNADFVESSVFTGASYVSRKVSVNTLRQTQVSSSISSSFASNSNSSSYAPEADTYTGKKIVTGDFQCQGFISASVGYDTYTTAAFDMHTQAGKITVDLTAFSGAYYAFTINNNKVSTTSAIISTVNTNTTGVSPNTQVLVAAAPGAGTIEFVLYPVTYTSIDLSFLVLS